MKTWWVVTWFLIAVHLVQLLTFYAEIRGFVGTIQSYSVSHWLIAVFRAEGPVLTAFG